MMTKRHRHWALAVLTLIVLGLVVWQVVATTSGPTRPFPVQRDPYWLHAREVVDRKVVDLLVRHRGELARRLRLSKLMRGRPGLREIALTFDDGPHPGFTPRILEILRRYHTPATFFVVGEQAKRYPELVKDELNDGHSVGNHTYHHVNLTRIQPRWVATEIKACGEVLANINNGRPAHLFRPPGGDYNDQVAEVSEALGYQLILWTDNPGDYRSPNAAFLRGYVVDTAHDGAIILLHDGVEQTVTVLPEILETLQKRGYKFVTVDRMLANLRPAPKLHAPLRSARGGGRR